MRSRPAESWSKKCGARRTGRWGWGQCKEATHGGTEQGEAWTWGGGSWWEPLPQTGPAPPPGHVLQAWHNSPELVFVK